MGDETGPDCGAGEKEQVNELKVSCNLNLAMVHLKLDNYGDAISHASAVLDIEGQGENVKALYRRGCARHKYGMLDEAKADLLKAAKLDPKNKAVRKE